MYPKPLDQAAVRTQTQESVTKEPAVKGLLPLLELAGKSDGAFMRPNEKEISHGRGSWQSRLRQFAEGPNRLSEKFSLLFWRVRGREFLEPRILS